MKKFLAIMLLIIISLLSACGDNSADNEKVLDNGETEYIIEFIDYDGMVIQTLNYDFGVDLSGVRAPADPAREGYTFDGWDAILPNKMPENNVIIYASYSIIQYSVLFDTTGGSIEENNTIMVNYGSSIILPSPTKPGFTFLGWYDGIGPNASHYTNSSTIVSDITLMARWDNEIFTLNFETNGGNRLDEIQFTYGEPVPTLPYAYREGFYNTGWYLDDSFNTLFEHSTYPANDIILYAKWEDSYTVFSNFMIDNATRFEFEYHTIVIVDDGYQLKLGCDSSDKYNRDRDCLSTYITLFDDGTLWISVKYIFSDNSSTRLMIWFDYGNMKSPYKIDYDVLDINDSRYIEDSFDYDAEYTTSGWDINLNPYSDLSGSIYDHQDIAELIGDLLMIDLEYYCNELGIPIFE